VEEIKRPVITNYEDPVEYIAAVLRYRKQTEKNFSVLSATARLRRVSPALVSLVLKGKRTLTLDRCDEFSQLMNLGAAERAYFKNWIASRHDVPGSAAPLNTAASKSQRKEVSHILLSDWLNVFVKDFFQIPEIQKNPERLFELLGHVATRARIEKSIRFLRREGYLRSTLDGRLEPETNLAVADTKVPSAKVRQFHKAALELARRNIELFPPGERLANTLIIPLNKKKYDEFLLLIEEFAEKLKDFAAANTDGENLYQFVLNLSPVGGHKK
jgi:uncharacterized protein (TIGR02147 family)